MTVWTRWCRLGSQNNLGASHKNNLIADWEKYLSCLMLKSYEV
jgi:hypothetical protein